MRKLGLLFGVFLLTFSSAIYAQVPEEKPVPESGLYRNSVFIELAGNAAVLSFNYERLIRFATPGKTLVLRAGTFLAPYGIKRNNFSYELFLPLEASVLMGKRAVKFEFGFGATLHRHFGTYINTESERIHYSRNEVFPIMRIGGRWQKPGKHWFVKVAATTFLTGNYFGMDLPVSPWAGISVGYNFGGKKK
jgi:hypothetical protein